MIISGSLEDSINIDHKDQIKLKHITFDFTFCKIAKQKYVFMYVVIIIIS